MDNSLKELIHINLRNFEIETGKNPYFFILSIKDYFILEDYLKQISSFPCDGMFDIRYNNCIVKFDQWLPNNHVYVGDKEQWDILQNLIKQTKESACELCGRTKTIHR